MIRLKIFLFILGIIILASCDHDDTDVSSESVEALSIDVAETSGQLASGTSFNLDAGKRPHHKKHGLLDGLNLLAPTDELLAIVDAESASDIRGLRVSQNGGATITNYDADGNELSVTLPGKNGPQGCSFSGHQFPGYDSLLSTIARTEIDFGDGVTINRDTVEITRAGKIIIERSTDGVSVIETTTFENYSVNGIQIEGTKTRTSSYDDTTGSGLSTTSVTAGKITLTDGTVATWTSERSRVSDLTAGTVTTEVSTSVIANGTTIYSHKTTTPLLENLNCNGRRPGPVSGVVETVYREDNISIDFGDGSCSNTTIIITVNGVTTTRTIGG